MRFALRANPSRQLGDRPSIDGLDARRRSLLAGPFGAGNRGSHWRLRYGVEKSFAVERDLAFADAVDGAQILERGGALFRHFQQGPVGENHIGGQPLVLGEVAPQLSERLENFPFRRIRFLPLARRRAKFWCVENFRAADRRAT